MLQKYILNSTIKFVGMPYCFSNVESDTEYSTLQGVLPHSAHVNKYGKHMVTHKIGSHLGCMCRFHMKLSYKGSFQPKITVKHFLRFWFEVLILW